jgi:hypothetical protein
MALAASVTAPTDQDALYYPYIHVRDVAWLKATLLCFPHVYRMVPEHFEINDREDVQPFTHTAGTRGAPLLGRANIDYQSVYPAQSRLAQRIERDIESQKGLFLARFSAQAATTGYRSGTSAFQIHRNKVFDDLFSVLSRNNLLWSPGIPNRGAEWLGIHPILGEAIMSTIAVALAQRDGLHILTSSEKKHRALAVHSADEVYEALVQDTLQASAPETPELTNRLAQLVIYSGFDVDRLTPEKIVELSKETTAFRDLRAKLIEECTAIPKMTNENRIDAYLKEAAGRIIAQWESHKPRTSKFLKDFFSLGLFDKTESGLKDAAKATLVGIFGAGATGVAQAAGATTAASVMSPLVLAAAPGLAVAVVYYGVSTARKQWVRQAESPFRFLSKVEKAGATFVASPGLARS